MKSLIAISNASELWNSEASLLESELKEIGFGTFIGDFESGLWEYFDKIVFRTWSRHFLLRNNCEMPVIAGNQWMIDIESLLFRLFSEAYILRNEITAITVQERFIELESQFSSYEEITGKQNERVYCLIEEQDYFRVSLIITPFKRDLKVTVTELENKGVRTFTESYFHAVFDPWNSFNKKIKRDELNFMEQQGWGQYPCAYNNKQFFEILFNVNQLFNQPDHKVGTISSLRQRKFLKEFLGLLNTVFGNDVFDSHKRDVSIKNDELNASFLLGRRIYALPDCDVIVTFSPIKVEGFVRKDIPIGAIDVNYLPRLKSEQPVEGYYLHPIVYEAGK